MVTPDLKDLITINKNADTPKYLQVSEGVIRAIEQKKLKKGDQLPSLRQLSDELDISFDTAKKAYDVLKKRNIVVAAQGKSNVINATGPIPVYRVFLLFNKLGSHKRIIYDAFTQAFTALAEIDLHVYNNNLHLFRHLLKTKASGYTHYVIIPHMADDPHQISEIIEEYLSGENIVLLGRQVEGIGQTFATVYEDFENDIFDALREALQPLKKYSVLNLVYPAESGYPSEIWTGFSRFCERFRFSYHKMTGISNDLKINKGEVFITVSDEDLAVLIQKIRQQQLEIGKDVGIISYNETPLKQVLLDGITTISTDFRKQGWLAAQQVISNTRDHLAVPSRLTLRPSL